MPRASSIDNIKVDPSVFSHVINSQLPKSTFNNSGTITPVKSFNRKQVIHIQNQRSLSKSKQKNVSQLIPDQRIIDDYKLALEERETIINQTIDNHMDN